jgi:hypothetical protein
MLNMIYTNFCQLTFFIMLSTSHVEAFLIARDSLWWVFFIQKKQTIKKALIISCQKFIY